MAVLGRRGDRVVNRDALDVDVAESHLCKQQHRRRAGCGLAAGLSCRTGQVVELQAVRLAEGGRQRVADVEALAQDAALRKRRRGAVPQQLLVVQLGERRVLRRFALALHHEHLLDLELKAVELGHDRLRHHTLNQRPLAAVLLRRRDLRPEHRVVAVQRVDIRLRRPLETDCLRSLLDFSQDRDGLREVSDLLAAATSGASLSSTSSSIGWAAS